MKSFSVGNPRFYGFFFLFCGNPLPNKVANRVTKKEQIIPVFTRCTQLSTVKKSSLTQLQIPPLCEFVPLVVNLGKETKNLVRTWWFLLLNLCILHTQALLPSCRMGIWELRAGRAQRCFSFRSMHSCPLGLALNTRLAESKLLQ